MSDTILLENSHPQAYDAALAKYLGSIPAAVIFHQLNFWAGKTSRRDGWFWKSSRDLEDETGLSDKQVTLAVKKLKDAGFIEVKLMRAYGAPTRHFRLSKTIKLVIGRRKQPKKSQFPITPKGNNPITPKGNNPIPPKGESNSPITQSNTQSLEQLAKLAEMKKRYGFK
jgi:DNA-binding transcriptional MocR family regulator